MATFNQEVFSRLNNRFRKIYEASITQNASHEQQLDEYFAAAIAEIIAAQSSTKNEGSAELLSIDEVTARTRLSRVVVQRMSQKVWRAHYNEIDECWQKFPAPVRMGKHVFYKEGDIDDWIDCCQSHETRTLISERRETRGRKRKSPQEIAAAVEAQIAGGTNAAL